MNKITFEKQKRDLCVLCDGVPYFTAYAPTVRRCGVNDGDLLTDAELEAFKNTCLEKQYAARADWLLSKRDYTAKQLSKKLGGEAEIADGVVAELAEEGLVDDEKYALRRAERLLCERLYSPDKTVFTLVGEGVDKELAVSAVEAAEYDEQAAVTRLVEKRYLRRLSEPDGEKKVAAALLRLGFHRESVRDALRELLQ